MKEQLGAFMLASPETLVGLNQQRTAAIHVKHSLRKLVEFGKSGVVAEDVFHAAGRGHNEHCSLRALSTALARSSIKITAAQLSMGLSKCLSSRNQIGSAGLDAAEAAQARANLQDLGIKLQPLMCCIQAANSVLEMSDRASMGGAAAVAAAAIAPRPATPGARGRARGGSGGGDGGGGGGGGGSDLLSTLAAAKADDEPNERPPSAASDSLVAALFLALTMVAEGDDSRFSRAGGRPKSARRRSKSRGKSKSELGGMANRTQSSRSASSKDHAVLSEHAKLVGQLSELKPGRETVDLRTKAATTPASLLLISRSTLQRPIQNHDGANGETKRLIFAPVLGVKVAALLLHPVIDIARTIVDQLMAMLESYVSDEYFFKYFRNTIKNFTCKK